MSDVPKKKPDSELLALITDAIKNPEKLENLHAAASILRAKEEAAEKQAKKDPDHIDSDVISWALNHNEVGDAELFRRLHRRELLYNVSIGEWMIWTGVHWQVDWGGAAHERVGDVAALYGQEAAALAKRIVDKEKLGEKTGDLKNKMKRLNARAFSLRGTTRAAACLKQAWKGDAGMRIKGDEIDQKPYLLPCKNGVINLKTGELEEGRHHDYLMKASPVEWRGLDAPCPLFEKTILEIMNENLELVDFLQRVFGMAMIGTVLQAVIVVLTGAGRNGKSLLDRVFNEILGPLAGPIRSEMLLDQMRTASSSGPTPDIMALRGLRMAFASETDNGCKISPSRVKWLTGNDRLTGRNPHDVYPTEFDPTHTLFLLTNYKPHAPADDFAFWERVILVPFELSFVNREPKAENERRADPHLVDKLRDEYPGILAWLVRGCLTYQQIGLQVPDIVKDATSEYQRDEDNLADFIEEELLTGEGMEASAKDLYERFEVWWSENISKRVPAKKWFGKMMGKKFERKKQGVIKYIGVGIPY